MANFKKYTVIFFIILISAISADAAEKKCSLYIVSGDGKITMLNVAIADTVELREKGLMYRKYMNDSDGMLFVFDNEEKLNFWMKNTYIPLDIAYIDKNGIINEIYHMKPLDVSVTYNSIKPAKYAIEVNRNWFSRHKIKTGTKIELNGCIRKQNNIIKR